MQKEKKSFSQPYFDRQERIAWWDQKRLFEARVLVVGAGALGNEVLKNLALLGVGHILVIDFDIIEDSNLSRTLLFRTEDAIGNASKALVAAKQTQQLTPNPNALVKPIHGNVVWEVGAGIFRHIDLVLGCLDNLEARLAVNLNCWQANKPWIDGGMWELSGSISIFDASDDKACFECSMTPRRYHQAKTRYSCTNETVKTRISQGQEPTTQTTSAIVAAIQSQEAIKLLHDIESFPGRQAVFNGASHFYTGTEPVPISVTELTRNPNCLCHEEEKLNKVIELKDACANKTTARQLLTLVESKTGLKHLKLALGRTFVIQATCAQCEQSIKLHQPLYKVRDVDTICSTCSISCHVCGFISIGEPDCPNCKQQDISEPYLETFHTLTLNDSSVEPFLDLPLLELGIPPLHIITLQSLEGDNIFVELSGDIASLWS